METEKNTKEAKPVYISTPKLEKLIKIAADHPNNTFTSKYFIQYGFGESDATLAVSSLRFLGLIDDGGKATDLMPKISAKNEDRKKQGFEEVVRKAYSKLFEGETKPYELSSDDLHDALRGEYGLSPRVARTAIPAFFKLCEYAGLREETKASSPRERTKRVSHQKNQTNRPSSGSKNHEPRSPSGTIQIINGEIGLLISENVAKKQIFDKKFRDLMDGLIEAAHKVERAFEKTETPESEESGEV